MRAVRAGEVDAIVCWQTSRLWRNRRERADGIEDLRRAAVSIFAVKGPDLDCSTAYGRGMAGLLGEFDTMESEVKSERILSAMAQNAGAGRPHGRTAYGWDRVYDTATGRSRDVLNAREAEVVREIADRIIHGDSLRGIVADLNSRGVPSPDAAMWAKLTDDERAKRLNDGRRRPPSAWGKPMLRAVVTRERNAGLRRHRGEIVGDAAWEPILERATWERACAVLADPSRRTSTGTAAAHLLSGIATCGVCGAPVRATMNRMVPSYKCSERSHVTRNRADVDAYVEGVVIGLLSRPDAASLFSHGDRDDRLTAAAEARDLEARLDQAADQYADGVLTGRQLERITTRLRPQIEAASARARRVDDAPLLDGLVGVVDVEEAWRALPLTRRRAVVALLMDVKILRSKPGARTFDPDAVSITPKV